MNSVSTFWLIKELHLQKTMRVQKTTFIPKVYCDTYHQQLLLKLFYKVRKNN